MHRTRPNVLDTLTPSELDLLSGRGVVRDLRRGETLGRAGETPSRVHLVVAGALKLVGRDFDGNETLLGLCLRGDVAGVVTLLDERPQPFDYVAATRATVRGVDRELFARVLAENPRAALETARLLTPRIRWLADATLERSSARVPSRLAGRLLDLAEMIGRPDDGAIEVDLPLSQRDLGALAGMCRESACRTLSRWRAQGTVDYEGRRLRIVRPEVLRAIRCAGRAAEPCRSAGAGASRRSRPRAGT